MLAVLKDRNEQPGGWNLAKRSGAGGREVGCKRQRLVR
jgi:hypothetical protein